jgi:hypothetical protein
MHMHMHTYKHLASIRCFNALLVEAESSLMATNARSSIQPKAHLTMNLPR